MDKVLPWLILSANHPKKAVTLAKPEGAFKQPDAAP